ncbi:hypothetical protein [Flavobacterium psychrophilum]|uniref:hypothetical protein n=1 Tax=Flavobacterium psychrophilum TaxID=96345 RepID=UPI0019343599|nr:hypothetical protein [Flavobacterium psychrophilum]QRE11429.1 hypothetical protein H0H30_00120 [Flavobacterium psychrophilum]QRE30590.1 hypothetical protein H0I48_00120 [Flavobacterium psychrophilum]QRE44912.1 hypothetical protein H0N61_00120 [Flavobacterium psychrophilum]
MKNLLQIKWMLLFVVFTASAQQEKGIIGASNWLSNWTEFKPANATYNETNQILYGKITANTTLFKKNTYLLQGPVYVTNNAILTIEPGTVIKGDYETNGALIITKGSQIVANGLETDPIVFTSNRPQPKPGDWGGVAILGDAPMNKFGGASSLNFDLDPSQTIYGGTNPQSNSGIVRFLRIEFAGKKIKGFKDYNAFSLASVGSKTVIENVMCSFAAGNSFEILGGDVTVSKLVSLRSSSDDFKFTQGAQCKIDNSLAIRHSVYSSSTRSRCMNVTSYEKKEEADLSKNQTNVTAINCSLVNTTLNLSDDIAKGLVKEAIYVGNNASFSIKRSVVSGFYPAAILSSEIKLEASAFKKIKFEEIYFNNCKGNIFVENTTTNDHLEDYYGSGSYYNLYQNTDNKEMFLDIYNTKNNPDFRIKISKITASNSK